jgi:transposase InsO family protein
MLAVLEEVKSDEKRRAIDLTEARVFPELHLTGGGEQTGNCWYLDNGASNHMTGDLHKFTELDEGVTGKVRFGDGSSVEIKGKGTILFRCRTGDQWALPDVYYIPRLRSNLVSLGQLTETGHRIELDEDVLEVHDKTTSTLIMKVKRSQNRLYKIDLKPTTPVCLLASVSEKAWLWHGRLGHVNFRSIKQMVSKSMVGGVPEITHPEELCHACLAGKQARVPFPQTVQWRATQPLELLHIDLCGPITPSTAAGNKYFMLIVDDCTRWMAVYALKSKDQACEMFVKFKSESENQIGLKIKCVRSDRGGEFLSGAFKEVCESAGIKRHFTAPYSPQQNGVVERKNRTIMEMTRSLMKSMGVPAKLWGEAVRHSIYLLNRLPTKAMGDSTPYEAWNKRKPHLGHLRVFGCTAHVRTAGPHLKKLEDRSHKMMYLGTDEGCKAHRLYDPHHNRIVVSRDVVF